MGNGVKRPYRIPDEDDEAHVLTITRGDLEILLNAIALYCLWLRERGTLPLEGQGDYVERGDPDHERIIQRLRELDISPKQLAVELKASALQHSERLRSLIEEELGNDV